jgi:hypothetical protein
MARKNAARGPILARLRDGPLPSSEWRGLCQSRHSLTANIYRLRCEGFDIRNDGRAGGPGVYVLTERPHDRA